MQIVIELPEIIAMDIAEGFPKAYIEVMADAIRKGRVLPKHGRLIDADKIADNLEASRDGWNYYGNEYEAGRYQSYDYALDEVMEAPTIIEADKGE